MFFKQLLKVEDKEIYKHYLRYMEQRNLKTGKNVFETGVAIKGNDNSVVIRLNKKDDNFLNELTKPQYRLRKYLVMWSDIKK